MSEKQVNELLDEINIDEYGDGFIDCGTSSDYTDNHQYKRIITAIKQNIELQQENSELNKKLEEVEKQGMETLLRIEEIIKVQKEQSDISNRLLKGISEYLYDIYDGKENELRIGDYIFNVKKSGVDFTYKPVKEYNPIKLEVTIVENSGESNVCPICGKEIGKYPALSRKDNKTEICSNCGMLEALAIFNESQKEKA